MTYRGTTQNGLAAPSAHGWNCQFHDSRTPNGAGPSLALKADTDIGIVLSIELAAPT